MDMQYQHQHYDHDQSDERVGVIEYEPDGVIGEVEQGERKPAEEKYCDHRDQKLAGPIMFNKACTGRLSKPNLKFKLNKHARGVLVNQI